MLQVLHTFQHLLGPPGLQEPLPQLRRGRHALSTRLAVGALKMADPAVHLLKSVVGGLLSGKHTKFALEKCHLWLIYLVKMRIFHSYVDLPEGVFVITLK